MTRRNFDLGKVDRRPRRVTATQRQQSNNPSNTQSAHAADSTIGEWGQEQLQQMGQDIEAIVVNRNDLQVSSFSDDDYRREAISQTPRQAGPLSLELIQLLSMAIYMLEAHPHLWLQDDRDSQTCLVLQSTRELHAST